MNAQIGFRETTLMAQWHDTSCTENQTRLVVGRFSSVGEESGVSQGRSRDEASPSARSNTSRNIEVLFQMTKTFTRKLKNY